MLQENPFERWRLLPLNQVAALKLREAGETPDAERLPVFQLMVWGLLNGVTPTHRRTAQELQRLQYQNPAEAFTYLTSNIPGGLPELHRKLLKLAPKAAASELLDILDMRLKADPRNPYAW
ncbi:hypothetical protein SAMN02745165_02199 [Malonomonas rubra DSM 5091]|uniref:Uncharacterized protein n=1 Tax=Malonomonas rubra DSM 5091 TaxID=1122189 RepID=A0A1M6IQ76_MALRU|nr:hypothetical protein [Malonomonas rubra]SHJ36499.1 hypothetical protein SAMN02745165_02199 [Malonomonas rubra DSM 5091]